MGPIQSDLCGTASLSTGARGRYEDRGALGGGKWRHTGSPKEAQSAADSTRRVERRWGRERRYSLDLSSGAQLMLREIYS